MKKICSKCGIEKETELFIKRSHNKDGVGAWCKECSRIYAKEKHSKNKQINNLRCIEWRSKNPEKVKEYAKKYHKEHPEQRSAYAKAYAEANKDKIKAYSEKTKERRAARAKIYRQENKERDKITREAWIKANPEKKRDALRRWREANPEKNRAALIRANRKRASNPKNRVSDNISRQIRDSLKKGIKNNQHWESFVDFTIDQLKRHLAKQFKPGMSWKNYGKDGWEIDHIIPLSAHNFNTPDHKDFKKAWSLKNLQPLWAKDNRSKSDKLTKHFQPSLAF